jgi:mono/diheme cytochrome c family protein
LRPRIDAATTLFYSCRANQLYFGDNLYVLRDDLVTESI